MTSTIPRPQTDMTASPDIIAVHPLTPAALGLNESLWGLIHRVALGDRGALERILGMLLFAWNGRLLTLLSLLDELIATERAWRCAGGQFLVLDAGRAQWTDKFSHIPDARENGQRRPDARFYYRAIANHIAASLAGKALPDALELERLSRSAFRRFAITHFYRSIRDCYRCHAGLRSRYVWKTLVLWLPKEIHGGERRLLLEELVPNVEPSAYGEQDRVQQLIDLHLVNRRIVSLDDIEPSSQPDTRLDLPSFLKLGISTVGLAMTIAEEKSARLDEQRPAIKALGAPRVKALVLRIFDAVESGEYRPGAIADEFNLDRATYGRFAGWQQWKQGDLASVPDLFRNIAWVVAQDPCWAECAKEAGIWPRLQEVLRQNARAR